MEDNEDLLGKISRQLSQMGPLPSVPMSDEAVSSVGLQDKWAHPTHMSYTNPGQTPFQNLYTWNQSELSDSRNRSHSQPSYEQTPRHNSHEHMHPSNFVVHNHNMSQGIWPENNSFLFHQEPLTDMHQTERHEPVRSSHGMLPPFQMPNNSDAFENDPLGNILSQRQAPQVNHFDNPSLQDQLSPNGPSMFTANFKVENNIVQNQFTRSMSNGSDHISHHENMHAPPMFDPRTPPPAFLTQRQRSENFASSIGKPQYDDGDIFTPSQRSKPTLKLDLGTNIESPSNNYSNLDRATVDVEDDRLVYKLPPDEWHSMKLGDISNTKEGSHSPLQSQIELSFSETSLVDKSKPSYSDIAKTLRSAPLPTSGKVETHNQENLSKPVSTRIQKKEVKIQRPPIRRTSSGSKFLSKGSSFADQNRCSGGLNYGLDSFREPVSAPPTLSSSSESLSHSIHNRRGSGSSVGSSVSALDEITLAGTGRLSNSELAGSNKAKAKEQESDTASGPSAPNAASPKQVQDKKEHVFFDPKRIFQPRKSQVHDASVSSKIKGTGRVGDKSFPLGAGDGNTLLNNGKPTAHTKLPSSAKQHDYINNDLRDATKLTNKTAEEIGKSAGISSSTKPSDVGEKYEKESRLGRRTNSRVNGNVKREKRKQADGSQKQSHGENGPHHQQDRPSLMFENLNTGKLEECMSLLWEKFSQWGNVFLIWLTNFLIYGLGLILFLSTGAVHLVLLILSKSWHFIKERGFKGRFTNKDNSNWPRRDLNRKRAGLEENIVLPATGDEAMKRLLACKGKDPYSILGLRGDSSDEEIKKYYRKQAVLVHPDKNQDPGAEEAFKILGHAFEMIGEPSKRKQYDGHMQEEIDAEAMREFADMLTKLQTKLQEAANIMRCDTCGGKHKRVPVDRPFYSARFCQSCNMHHQAKEGDVWAESTMLGFYWHYYALMEGHVYDITEWMRCHRDCFKHMKANVHNVMFRIATDGSRKKHHPPSDANLEELINQLFKSKAGMAGRPDGAWPSPPSDSTSSAGPSSSAGRKAGRKKRRR